MEKLIELLKQYWKETFNDETLLRIYYEEKTDCFYWMYQPRPGMKLEQGQMLETPVVFSKSFGFIERLVDTDKIDRDKLEKKVLKEDLIRKFDEGLIMLLSISDTPIDDLISYLR